MNIARARTGWDGAVRDAVGRPPRCNEKAGRNKSPDQGTRRTVEAVSLTGLWCNLRVRRRASSCLCCGNSKRAGGGRQQALPPGTYLPQPTCFPCQDCITVTSRSACGRATRRRTGSGRGVTQAGLGRAKSATPLCCVCDGSKQTSESRLVTGSLSEPPTYPLSPSRTLLRTIYSVMCACGSVEGTQGTRTKNNAYEK